MNSNTYAVRIGKDAVFIHHISCPVFMFYLFIYLFMFPLITLSVLQIISEIIFR